MTYIHPSDKQILAFIEKQISGSYDLESICERLFAWFDREVEYSRLNAPYFPLQRSDLDLLAMGSGTCGDYSNLLVSVFLAMGFEAYYAYVHEDCYGDEQDHICAAVRYNGRDILIDATQPYRKWFGFDCPHRNFELLSPGEFEDRMKKEEQYWCSVADQHHLTMSAGLLYAPWIHAECVFDTEARTDDVFFLLSLDRTFEPTLYVYYQQYTKQGGFLPIMAAISKEKTLYYFSVHPRDGLWDDAQWSKGFSEQEIPQEYMTAELQLLKSTVLKRIERINDILHGAGLQGLIL